MSARVPHQRAWHEKKQNLHTTKVKWLLTLRRRAVHFPLPATSRRVSVQCLVHGAHDLGVCACVCDGTVCTLSTRLYAQPAFVRSTRVCTLFTCLYPPHTFVRSPRVCTLSTRICSLNPRLYSLHAYLFSLHAFVLSPRVRTLSTRSYSLHAFVLSPRVCTLSTRVYSLHAFVLSPRVFCWGYLLSTPTFERTHLVFFLSQVMPLLVSIVILTAVRGAAAVEPNDRARVPVVVPSATPARPPARRHTRANARTHTRADTTRTHMQKNPRFIHSVSVRVIGKG